MSAVQIRRSKPLSLVSVVTSHLGSLQMATSFNFPGPISLKATSDRPAWASANVPSRFCRGPTRRKFLALRLANLKVTLGTDSFGTE